MKKRSLKKHMKTHTQPSPLVERQGKKIAKEKMMYICTFEGCKSPFSQYISLKRHFSKAHCKDKDNQEKSLKRLGGNLPEEIFV